MVVATSLAWQTTCTLVRSGEEAFLVDSPVLPDELAALPSVAEQAGFRVVGALATHGDWDHLLARSAFPEAAFGVAESTAARLRAEPGAPQRALRDFDAEWYVERDRPLALGELQALPVPGRLDLGTQELELHPAPGHVADGMAVLVPWARVLCCGDYLSPVEIPMISEGGSRDGYLETLAVLEGLIESVDHVVPGHGPVLDAERALALLREDRAYVSGLPDSDLPLSRRSPAQRRIHAENLSRL